MKAPGSREHGTAERISGAESCFVDRCPCGSVHLHIGALTVRLGAEEFARMASVIGEAAAVLAPGGRRH